MTKRSLDLTGLSIPDVVRMGADNIFRRLNLTTHRGKKRKQLVFFCVRTAYDELGMIYDPVGLGLTLGLTVGDMTRAMSIYSELQTGIKREHRLFTASMLLPGFCESLGLIQREAIEEVVTFCDRLTEKHPGLLEIKPYNVAAGVLRYYFVTHGLEGEDLIPGVCHVAENTVTAMYGRISRLDNGVLS